MDSLTIIEQSSQEYSTYAAWLMWVMYLWNTSLFSEKRLGFLNSEPLHAFMFYLDKKLSSFRTRICKWLRYYSFKIVNYRLIFKPVTYLNYETQFTKLQTFIHKFSKTLHKKWSFLLRISSVNETKFAVSCGFGHIYWRNP